MKIKIFGGLLMAALAVTTIAQAQTNTPVINHRQNNQERRINQGVRSGELTHREAHNLRHGERNIREEKHTAMAEGRMGPRERAYVRHQENHLSRKIYRKKHNARIR